MSDVVAERRHQVFPKLNDAQLQRIARYGERRHVRAGEILPSATFARGVSSGSPPPSERAPSAYSSFIARWPSERS